MQKHRKREPNSSIEISIVGGGFDVVGLPYHVDFAPGSYIFLKYPEVEEELLVKVRGFSKKVAGKILDRFRIAGNDEIISTMKKITKGFLFENNLRDVKIVKEEFDIGKGIITFKFTAERKLKLDKVAAALSKILHVRVEFQQIGARDLARITGGVGICGFEICCRRFLKILPSVTLETAKEQFIFASPDRISGICGRLRCCLRYELEYYRDLKSKFPEIGSVIETDKGPGRVAEINYLAKKIKLQFGDGTEEEMDWNPVGVESFEGEQDEV
uniref:Stage 0 sporulation protein n=1 Tax=candidate division WOR-3 bacterium TaxID=2052148 RepID=A0A7C2PEL6_UNCW3